MNPITSSRLRWAAILVSLSLAGCAGPSGRLAKQAGSGLWVDQANASRLDGELAARIAEAGIREIFIPLADLDLGRGESPVQRRPVPDLPAGTRLTVVVAGGLGLAGRDLAQTARAVAEGLQQLTFDIEARGLVPVGVHFDLSSMDSMEAGASFFKKLRGGLDRAAFVSVTLRREWMDDPEMPKLVEAVDFVVPFLYGQREGEPDSSDAWDFDVARQRLGVLEAAGARYMMGIVGIGSVTHTDSHGQVKNTTSVHALHPFMWNRDLELKRGFSLEATNRRVYTLVAKAATQAGGWQIRPKDEIRLVRPMTTDLDQLLGIVEDGDYPGLLGKLFYRLPAPEEQLSITVENILNAVADEPVSPDLGFEVQVTRRTGRGAMYRFIITNSNGETTEFSLNNYVQVTAEPNAFGNVELGDFYRYDLRRLKPDGGYEQTFRNANVVRLHIPVLEGQQRVESGDVEIRLRNPTLLLDARFMMPDGRTVEFGPYTWKDGEFLDADTEEKGEPAE